ncbi:phosphoethanolamine n-methyltransferase 3 [Fusarium mundagurra]|uniref:Phosphoethanolamine n-methyltransferase 3 n=2 Tax=Fusarium TaxID=5506 RepID=A0A8H6D339_9HYPO|nr:phosphoethanolamine n-methyltransferase 3 [Fusarium beomiforme]KAF5701789.1 phosphoethanolamine n-methyltransferase 3 [Fusarium mundagurra]
MALMHQQNGDQARYKVLQWLQRDGDALLSEASSPSNFSTSNSPSSKPLATTSTSNISESETTEYSNVPSEWFECFTLEGRQVPKNVSGAWEPIDEPAWKSSRLFHQLWRAINDNRLYYSPVHRPQLVADIGCGTCTWSMDFAELNPGSHVIAVDKSPFMPTYLQPNVETILGDLCLDLPFNGGTADLVFLRQLVWCNDLGVVFRNAGQLLKPAGWIEFTLLKPKALPKHQAWCYWERQTLEVTRRTSRLFPTFAVVKQLIQDAGFSGIRYISKSQTVSQCGLNLTDLRHFDVQGQIMLPLHEGLELPLAEIERLAVGMRRELSEDMEFET